MHQLLLCICWIFDAFFILFALDCAKDKLVNAGVPVKINFVFTEINTEQRDTPDDCVKVLTARLSGECKNQKYIMNAGIR